MSIDINLTALQTFSTELQETLNTHLGSESNVGDMIVRTGTSQLPSAATMSSWYRTMLHMTAVHDAKMRLGGQAIQLAALSVAAAYRTADGEAESEIAAVRDAFYPPAGTPSLAQTRAQAAEQGDESDAEVDPALTTPPLLPVPTNDATDDGEPPEPESIAETLQNVEDNADIAALGTTDGYDAPEDTPEELYGVVPGTEAPDNDNDEVIMAPGGGGRPDQVA